MQSHTLRSLTSLLLALAVAFVVLGAPAAQPAFATPPVYIVDRTDDVVVATCSVGLSDCSLRGAVQNANANPGSTIELDPSATYVLSSGAGELVLSTTTTLNSSAVVCLVGACSAVIQGGPGWSNRLLEIVPGAGVSVDHVEFTGGNANNGGALMNSGTLTLTSSLVFSNTAGGWGGGILNYGTLTLSNTVVNGNKALVTGGAIANQADVNLPGTMTIVNSAIITNVITGTLSGTGDGGGISSFNNVSQTIQPLVTIINTSILTNTGTITGFGGGLFLDGNTTLTNVTLQGNSAAGGGGAYVHFGQLTMQGGTVVSNTALTSGGSGGGFRNDGRLTLSGVLVTENHVVGGGGGAVSSSSPFTVTNSTFTHDSADGSGGVIFLAGPSAVLLLDHSNLISNISEFGGAIAGYGTVTVTNNSLISGNTALQGGALYISAGGRAFVTGNSQIINNETSGGAVGDAKGGGVFNSGLVQIQNASVIGNIAQNGGGAGLYNSAGSQATLTNAAVVSNQAQAGPGGGVANLGVLTVTASAIVSNTSVASGGGISNTGKVSILNTTLSSNSAVSGGGGFFNNGEAQLNFVTVAMNTSSGGQGGGLANTGALTLSNTLLGNNTGVPDDCAGAVTSLGHNLIADTTGCTLSGPGGGDKLNLDPKITALIDQGAALIFHDLLDHSPALDSADPAGGACPATDQRGVARPIGPHCDIGAIESSALAFYYTFLPLVRR